MTHQLTPMPEPPSHLVKEAFKERYEQLLGPACYATYMEYNFSYARKSIRVNTLKADPDEIKQRLSERWKLEPIPWCQQGFWIDYAGDDEQEKRFDIGNLPEHALGYIYVQDAASMIPPVVLQPKPGDMVLDMCAAPGSKTSQMAAMMKNSGLLIANDLQAMRLQPLAVNMQRMGVHNVVVTRMAGQQFKKKSARFDKILVDAPCSGTGTIRRSSKVLKMWSLGLIGRLVRTQRLLASSAFEVLKVGGEMVYSTCTQEPEENEGVVSWLVEQYPEAEVLPIELDIKRSEAITAFDGKEYHESVKHCLRIYPQDNDTEGFFVCKLRKNPSNDNE